DGGVVASPGFGRPIAVDRRGVARPGTGCDGRGGADDRGAGPAGDDDAAGRAVPQRLARTCSARVFHGAGQHPLPRAHRGTVGPERAGPLGVLRRRRGAVDMIGALTIPFTSFEIPIEIVALGAITGLT